MSTISASTTSTTAYKVTADTTGALVLQTGATPTTALTIDASQNVTLAKGITVGATAAPAFRAYRNGSQTISAATTTKVALNAESFDTNGNFDSTTNYRFTPTVAGYYQVNGLVAFTTGAGQAVIYKNGSTYTTGVEVTYNGSLGGHLPVSDLIYLNGSTDYIELYVYLTTGTTISSGESNTAFSASMARSA